VKVGDRFVLRHLGDEVVPTRHLGKGRVEVAFWPKCVTHLIVTAEKSLIAIAQREAS
jgi:hypothetical protein